MAKHKKCKNCKGRGTILTEIFNKEKHRFFMEEVNCPVCNGSGFEDKKENDNDEACIIHETD